MTTHRAANRVTDRRSRRRNGGFADPMDIGYALRLEHMNSQLSRHIFKRGDHIVRKIWIGNAPIGVLEHFLEQHLAEAEGRRPLDLQLAEARIDYFAGVKLSVDARHGDLSG